MNWKRAEIVEKSALLQSLNEAEPQYRFYPEDTIIETLNLPFYPQGTLVRVQKAGKPLWYVKLPEELVPLDGSSANLNYIDAKAPPVEKGTAYERFRKIFGSKDLPQDFSL